MRGKVLVLRTCDEDMTSHSGFVWPESGPVEAPDWDPTLECGGGLHGFLWGEGNGDLADWSPDAKWLVVEVDSRDIVDLGDKVKFPRGTVLYCGDRLGATEMLRGKARRVIGSTNTGGDYSTNAGGDRSTNVGGDRSINTGGDDSANKGGDCSTNTGGYNSTNTGGDYSTNKGGDYSTNTGGDYSTNTGGHDSANTGGNGSTNVGEWGSTNTGGDHSTNTGWHHSTNTGGHRSTNIGGYGSTNVGGNHSTNTGRYGSVNSGGIGSTLIFQRFDGERDRIVVAYVGEDGIEPNVPYKLDADGKVVRA